MRSTFWYRPANMIFLSAFSGCVLLAGMFANSAVSQERTARDHSKASDPFGDSSKQPAAMILHVYDVSDLILDSQNTVTVTNQPFQGFLLPGLSKHTNLLETDGPNMPENFMGAGGGGAGGGGFGGGGFGGGGSINHGGAFCIPATLAVTQPKQFGGSNSMPSLQIGAIEELSELIQTVVAQEAWEFNGGPGRITVYQQSLLIQTTEAVHKQVRDFFKTLLEANKVRVQKTRSADGNSITIKAYWLTFSNEQFQDLDIAPDQTLQVDVLTFLQQFGGRRGQLTCLDGQTVHLAAGNLKSTVESVIPVVGQQEVDTIPNSLPQALVSSQQSDPGNPYLMNESQPKLASPPKKIMAQVLESNNDEPQFTSFQNPSVGEKVGYQPVTRLVSYGAVLQVTPKLSDDRQRVHLDLTSILIEPTKAEQASPKTGSLALDVDRLDILTQQFSTSVVLKNSTKTLVGGSSISGNQDPTYLIIEAIWDAN